MYTYECFEERQLCSAQRLKIAILCMCSDFFLLKNIARYRKNKISFLFYATKRTMNSILCMLFAYTSTIRKTNGSMIFHILLRTTHDSIWIILSITTYTIVFSMKTEKHRIVHMINVHNTWIRGVQSRLQRHCCASVLLLCDCWILTHGWAINIFTTWQSRKKCEEKRTKKQFWLKHGKSLYASAYTWFLSLCLLLFSAHVSSIYT